MAQNRRTASILERRPTGERDPIIAFRAAGDADDPPDAPARPAPPPAPERGGAQSGEQARHDPSQRPEARHAAEGGPEEYPGEGEPGDYAHLALGRELDEDSAELAALFGELPELAGELWGSLFEVMAMRRGPHWFLTAEEQERLGKRTIGLINSYVNLNKITKAGPKLAFGIALGMPLSKRMYADAQFARAAMQQEILRQQAAAANQQWQDPPLASPIAPPAGPPDPSQYAVPAADPYVPR